MTGRTNAGITSSGGGEKHYSTIAVTTSDFMGEQVRCVGTDYDKTATFSDEGEAFFTVNDWGTYTLTCKWQTKTVDVTAWYVTYEVNLSSDIEITFTVEGAKEDNIQIINPTDNSIVENVIFPTGATSAEVTLVIPVEGKEYTFKSSVAKALDGSGNDYEKVVLITNSTTEVKSRPDGVIEWYGYVNPNFILGNTYTFDAYSWTVAEINDNSSYAVLQSQGVTGGTWPGYKMSGTLVNGSGETITLTNANTNCNKEIWWCDISRYDSTTSALYNSISASEKTGVYGKGLYLIKPSQATDGAYATYYRDALKAAAANYSSFGVYDGAWFGSSEQQSYSYYAWNVNSGGVFSRIMQSGTRVVAPAFNLDLTKVKLDGNNIVLLDALIE